MTPSSTVYRASWVVPVTSPPIPDGALRVDANGRIEALGPAAVVAEGARVTDLGAAVVLPGLVNVHAHPELTLLRGRLESADFPTWIERLIELKYERLGREAIRVATRLGVAEAIAAGVTCLAATDDAGFLLEAMSEAGLRGRVYRESFGPDPERAEPAVRDLRGKIDEMRERATDLVDVGISPHASFTVSARLMGMLADYAERERLPVCVHAAESAAEDLFVREGSGPFADRLRARGIEVRGMGRSPVAFLEETGLLGTRPLLVHCVGVDEDDVSRIARAGASVAHCPVSNAKFGHGVAPLGGLVDAGIAVGLGSDSVASNNRIDILEEARFALLMHRSLGRGPGPLDAARALELATIGGARALGIDERVGSLEVGKDADLIAIGLGRPNTTPLGDPVAGLVHSARGADVRLTVVRGRVLYDAGGFGTLDWPELAESAGHLAAPLL